MTRCAFLGRNDPSHGLFCPSRRRLDPHDSHGLTRESPASRSSSTSQSASPAWSCSNRATSGEGVAAKLASIAQHATDVRVAVVLFLLSSFSALVLAVTLYAITREQDPDLAMLALTCRVGEGVISVISIPETLGLLWLATATGANAPDTGAAHALGAYLLRGESAPPQSSSPWAARSSPGSSCAAE